MHPRIIAFVLMLGFLAIMVGADKSPEESIQLNIVPPAGLLIDEVIVRADINGDGIMDDDEVAAVFEGEGVGEGTLFLDPGIGEISVEIKYKSNSEGVVKDEQ